MEKLNNNLTINIKVSKLVYYYIIISVITNSGFANHSGNCLKLKIDHFKSNGKLTKE